TFYRSKISTIYFFRLLKLFSRHPHNFPNFIGLQHHQRINRYGGCPQKPYKTNIGGRFSRNQFWNKRSLTMSNNSYSRRVYSFLFLYKSYRGNDVTTEITYCAFWIISGRCTDTTFVIPQHDNTLLC